MVLLEQTHLCDLRVTPGRVQTACANRILHVLFQIPSTNGRSVFLPISV